MAPRIRPADADDAEDIAQIWYDAWSDGHRGNVPEALLAYRTRDQFSPRAAERVPHSWVAEVDGRTVGFVTVDGDEVEQIFVDATARGTGLATLLLDEGVRTIKA
ncbi:MAG TPA: GNAT family N-acetyltransferase, partial [Nocardioidaceae bacterium]